MEFVAEHCDLRDYLNSASLSVFLGKWLFWDCVNPSSIFCDITSNTVTVNEFQINSEMK